MVFYENPFENTPGDAWLAAEAEGDDALSALIQSKEALMHDVADPYTDPDQANESRLNAERIGRQIIARQTGIDPEEMYPDWSDLL